MALITTFPKGKRLFPTVTAVGGLYYDPPSTLYDNNDATSKFGVLLNPGETELKVELTGSVIIYAISNYYKDSGGVSGKNLEIYKKDNTGSYVLHQTVPTQGSNNGWYELCRLKVGSYWLKAVADYVTFTEWFVTSDVGFYINTGSKRYTLSSSNNITMISDENVLKGEDTTLENINNNLTKILTETGETKFKIEVIKRS